MAQFSLQHCSPRSPFSILLQHPESRLPLRGYLGMGRLRSKSLKCWLRKLQMVILEYGVYRRAHKAAMRPA